MKKLSIVLAIVCGFLLISNGYSDSLFQKKTKIFAIQNSLSGDTTPPAFSSATIDGTTLVITWSEACTQGGSYNDNQLDLDMSTTGSNIAVTYASGDGTDTWTYTAASAAVNGETVDLDFDGTADSIEDGSGNDLAALTSETVTNNTAPAGCAGGTTSGLGAYTNADNRTVNTENLLVYSIFTVDTGTDGEGNTVDVGLRYLASGNFVNAGVWHIVDANTATLLADGPNTAQGTGGGEDHFTITLDASACMVNGETYAVGMVVSGTDTSFGIYTSGYSAGAHLYTVTLSGGESLSGFDPSTATQLNDKNLGISLTYVAP
jgi:hypothetical protein